MSTRTSLLSANMPVAYDEARRPMMPSQELIRVLNVLLERTGGVLADNDFDTFAASIATNASDIDAVEASVAQLQALAPVGPSTRAKLTPVNSSARGALARV